MPVGSATLKPAHSAPIPDWRALVPEVLDGTVERPAAAQKPAEKRPAELLPSDTNSPSTFLAEAPRRAASSSEPTPASPPHGDPIQQTRHKVEFLTASEHTISAPGREAAHTASIVADTLQAQRPRHVRETPSGRAQSSNQSAAQKAALMAPQLPSKHDEASPLSEIKPRLIAAASRALESKPNPAPKSTPKTSTDPAPRASSSTSRPQLSHKPQSDHAQSDPTLLPLTARSKPASEPNPKDRPSARVHIGKLEIRMSAPPQPIAPQQAAKPAQQQRPPQPTPATPPQPLARELAWTYGLVQG
jgi:hypothetical protein